jgi:hypothetical protein
MKEDNEKPSAVGDLANCSTPPRKPRLARLAEPRGVHRFQTWEEFNAWKAKYNPAGGYRKDTQPET